MSEQEFVEMTIKVPKNVADFLRDVAKLSGLNVAEYLRDCVIKSLLADVDTMPDETPFWDLETLKAKYRLEWEGWLKDE